MVVTLVLDGEKRIPIFTFEEIEIDRHVETIKVEREWIHSRDQLEERKYRGGDIEPVIQSLDKGDKVHVKTYAKSYKNQTLTMSRGGDDAEGVNENGKEFHLLPRYWGERNQGDGQPWLRTVDGWNSRGQVEEIEILNLA